MADVMSKETKEAVHAIVELYKAIRDLGKDGYAWNDLPTFINKVNTDAAFQMAMLAGFEGINKVPAELTPMTLAKGFDLVMFVVNEINSTITPK